MEVFLGIFLGTLGASLAGNLLTGKENEPKFNGVYSRNNLSETKDGAYIINLDQYESIASRQILVPRTTQRFLPSSVPRTSPKDTI